jgi:hypothetical protein
MTETYEDPTTELDNEVTPLDELKQEADELGVTYSKAIGLVKLQAKVDAFYKAKEGPAISVPLEKVADTPVNGNRVSDKDRKKVERKRNASKTRIVSLVDNDQRSNNHTTTCTANCSNEFFDLGTKVLPLNEKIEVMQGHLNVLKAVRIPLHAKDPKTGLSVVKMRPRYTISYEDIQ